VISGDHRWVCHDDSQLFLMFLFGNMKVTVEVKLHTKENDIFLNTRYTFRKVLQWLEP
jgi:hypothetical protein